jgi:DNA-binding LacI/PurR family transcriptional regulator
MQRISHKRLSNKGISSMKKPSGAGAGIRDVAQLAGVSPSTVSRVLNDKIGGVQMSTATIERIRNAAMTLHYQPNAAARSLRTTHAQTIGVIARYLVHPFVAELLRVISAGCRARGYHLLLAQAGPDSAEGWLFGDTLSADRVDGVLLLGDVLPEHKRKEDMERLIQTHNHVVTVGAHPSVAGELSIMVDDERGVWLALDHLVAMGHLSIGYLSQHYGPESWEDQRRRAAYRGFLSTHGLPTAAGAELVVTNQIESIREALQSLFALPNHPTAVFVCDDLTALMTLNAARTCGIRVPDDLSVVGFDDIPFAALCTPGLTTVRQPIDIMGHQAACALLDRITGKEPAASPPDGTPSTNTLVFPPTLACRESVRPYQL